MKMNTSTHLSEQEEVMAYLDGELREDRAAVVTVHLDSCDECRKLTADLKNVSQKLQGWQVELPEDGPSLPVVGTEVAQESVLARRPWFERHLISWGVPAAVCSVIVIGTIRLIGTNANTVFQVDTRDAAVSNPQQTIQFDRLDTKLQKAPNLRSHSIRLPAPTSESNGPAPAHMIVRTASLGITVQEFDKARSHLDQILARHRGYLGDLEVSTPNDQARVLKGTLRVPTGQMDSTLTELKSLGRIESESQNGQEVSAQYVDLQARLANSRNTEQRLTEVLQQRTGKLSDVLEVETEIARVRGEIETMEAERKSLATQVAFATINVTLTEDYKPQLETVPPSTLR
jgi:uncharacterized protein DUF4349/putative zinc finger protein